MSVHYAETAVFEQLEDGRGMTLLDWIILSLRARRQRKARTTARDVLRGMSREELVDIGVDPDSVPACISLLPSETAHVVAARALAGWNA